MQNFLGKIRKSIYVCLRRISNNSIGKYTWRPYWAEIKSEASVHPHCQKECAELFEASDGESTEFEVLNWLHATIRLLKPRNVLETGAAFGLGTIAMASACKLNGFGKVHSVEIRQDACARLARRVNAERLNEFVEIHNQDSLAFLGQTSFVFDIGFFDSLCEIRAEEFRICLQRGLLKTAGVFHDTSPFRCVSLEEGAPRAVHEKYRSTIQELAKHPCTSGYFESCLSRGFVAVFLKKSDG